MQAKTTIGDRLVCVERDSISVFLVGNQYRSRAAWIAGVSSDFEDKYWITPCDAFPAEVDAFITDILEAGAPLQPLCDWLIEYGPKMLAREIEVMMAGA
jgi:hypothetical protein